MSGNTFGRVFRLTTYGESHGPGLGGVVDGCPAGLPLCEEDLQRELDARRPGPLGKGGRAGTARSEMDKARLLSGVFQGQTTGTPIAFHVDNTDQLSHDYSRLADILRPGHADLGFSAKYGFRDYRGGGRSSGRETVSRVAGGAIAGKFLAALGIRIFACTVELGGIQAPVRDIAGASARPYFCPSGEQSDAVVEAWEERITAVKGQGDTLGGMVRIEAHGLPAGLGEPVFDKLDARLAYACMGVGAVKGVEIGRGFAAARLLGSENNDPLVPADAAAAENMTPAKGTLPCPNGPGVGYGFASNNAGGVLGGLSSGAPLSVTAAVKPIASIGKEQRTLTLCGEPASVVIGGRHDISAIPRIVPVLKAMVALTLADFVLLQRSARLAP